MQYVEQLSLQDLTERGILTGKLSHKYCQNDSNPDKKTCFLEASFQKTLLMELPGLKYPSYGGKLLRYIFKKANKQNKEKGWGFFSFSLLKIR